MTTFEASNNTSQLRLKEIHGNLWRFMAGFWILWRLACYDFMVIQCYPAQGLLPLDQNDDLYDDGQAHWCLSAEAWSYAALAFLLPIYDKIQRYSQPNVQPSFDIAPSYSQKSSDGLLQSHEILKWWDTKKIWHLCVPTNQDKTKINWNYALLYIDYDYS